MMEVQEEEEEAPDKRQGQTYNHTHPHTTPQEKQDPIEPNESVQNCEECGLCTCNCCQSAEDYMDESEVGPSNPSAHQPPLRRSTRQKKAEGHPYRSMQLDAGLVSNNRPLKTAHPIPKGTLFTQFGVHSLQKQTHPRVYNAFMVLRQKINTEPGHERLQYIVEAEEAYWIPPNDQPLISRSSPSTQLQTLLTSTPPTAGFGQYTNHSCCEK